MHMQQDMGFLTNISAGISKIVTTGVKATNAVANPAGSLAQKILEGATVYKQTQAILRGGSSPAYVPPTQSPVNLTSQTSRILTGAELKSLQTMLRDQGYDPGPIDGIFGPRTQAAIVAYQRANFLEPDGKPTESLYRIVSSRYQPPMQTVAPAPIPSSGGQSSIVIAQPQGQIQTMNGQAPAWLVPAAIGVGGILLAMTMRGNKR